MNIDEKMQALSSIFESWDKATTPETRLDQTDWDSMAMMGLVALLKSRFNKQIRVADLKQMITINDLLQLLP